MINMIFRATLYWFAGGPNPHQQNPLTEQQSTKSPNCRVKSSIFPPFLLISVFINVNRDYYFYQHLLNKHAVTVKKHSTFQLTFRELRVDAHTHSILFIWVGTNRRRIFLPWELTALFDEALHFADSHGRSCGCKCFQCQFCSWLKCIIQQISLPPPCW